MKNSLFILLALFFISCNETNKQEKLQTTNENGIDIEAELKSIEETRTGFELAIKEKRYSDLKNFGTKDIISLTPICGEWEDYKNLRENPTELFSYDSLVMRPIETIIVSDSVAYDFGTSSVYYTNANGEPVEITDTFLAILKKDKKDGQWKLHREVATTNMLKQNNYYQQRNTLKTKQFSCQIFIDYGAHEYRKLDWLPPVGLARVGE